MEGKRIEEKDFSDEKTKKGKVMSEKKMSAKQESAIKEKRCFLAKESEIVGAIEKEETVLLLLCKGTYVSINDQLSTMSNSIVKVVE